MHSACFHAINLTWRGFCIFVHQHKHQKRAQHDGENENHDAKDVQTSGIYSHWGIKARCKSSVLNLERHIIVSYGNQAKFMLQIIAVLHADIINISAYCVLLYTRWRFNPRETLRKLQTPSLTVFCCVQSKPRLLVWFSRAPLLPATFSSSVVLDADDSRQSSFPSSSGRYCHPKAR